MVFIVIGTLYYLRSHAYSRSPHTAAPKYRKRNRRIAMKKMHQRALCCAWKRRKPWQSLFREKDGAPRKPAQFPERNQCGHGGCCWCRCAWCGRWWGPMGGIADDLDLRELLERLEANRDRKAWKAWWWPTSSSQTSPKTFSTH